MEFNSLRPAEKNFYLAEFRGRSLGIVLAGVGDSGSDLKLVLAELAENPTRCVLISSDRALLEEFATVVTEPNASAAWPAEVWHAIDSEGRVGVHVAEGPDPRDEEALDFAAQCRRVTLKLQLSKLLWVRPSGGLLSESGERISLVDLEQLRLLQAREEPDPATASLLREIGVMLQHGTPSISLCGPEGMVRELFTYSGSGTLFTRERYTHVRDLGLDDFDAAADLIRVGTEEGFLLPRSASDIRYVLAHAFGVFIEGRYLAGIGSLLPYPSEAVGEIASLYTVTRFAREGIGEHLVYYALEKACQAGLDRVFACTTSEKVEGFFLRQGFERVEMDALPDSKWVGHSEERLGQVVCLARSTASSPD